ncbi:MAG: hypothetical protein H8E20_14645 [Verrucomicrobia bacterium]|nr:hypothetical protein [Verrucomicrobiota bacterium]
MAKLLITLGCPTAKAGEMAAQLAKRAGQLAKERDIPREQAIAHLLNLMRQGWAAKEQTDAD